MSSVAAAALVGLAAGFVFGAGRLPVPAPPTLAGVVGVAALALGWHLGRLVRGV